MKKLAMSAVISVLAANSALALEVKKNVDVAAAPDAVWKAIGDFCGIANWHPAVERSRSLAEGMSDVGRVAVAN